MEKLDSIVETQLSLLDDADDLASAWIDALKKWNEDPSGKLEWGGRGRGGRGLARQTFQPTDVVVNGISLEYAGSDVSGRSRTLIDGSSSLKLLHGHVYALVGRNGTGKSTLLRRIHAGTIPGFPPHIRTNLIPQEVFGDEKTALEVLLQGRSESLRNQISELELQLEALDVEDTSDEMEELCERIAELEDERAQLGRLEDKASHALKEFGINDCNLSLSKMSGGLRKKVYLASALFSLNSSSLLMLDEPTNMLDIEGIFQLRKLITVAQDSGLIVLLVTHDIDLMNDCATDVINLSNARLDYYKGNYCDFKISQSQLMLHKAKQQETLERERSHMLTTIDNIKKKSGGKVDKKAGMIASRKKKLERHGIMKDPKGHRWTAQKACTGIREGSINSIDASTRRKFTYAQLLSRVETKLLLEPDKAVHFQFPDPSNLWNEPLIMAIDVSYGYEDEDGNVQLLLDSVDMCIEENSRVIILGKNGSGKTSLLKMLCGEATPLSGTIHRAAGVKVSYFSQHVADDLIEQYTQDGVSSHTAISLVMEKFSHKNEETARANLSSFGLGPSQVTTKIEFLSGGERCRLCLTLLMLGDLQPSDLLIMDEPTINLDAESVEALAFGLMHWKGSVVMVSHDANLVRTLGGTFYLILDDKKNICRVTGGIDSYLRSIS